MRLEAEGSRESLPMSGTWALLSHLQSASHPQEKAEGSVSRGTLIPEKTNKHRNGIWEVQFVTQILTTHGISESSGELLHSGATTAGVSWSSLAHGL